MPVDNKNISNMKTDGEKSIFKAKQQVKDNKAKGKRSKKSNNNDKDVPKKQISVFDIKQYSLSRRLSAS